MWGSVVLLATGVCRFIGQPAQLVSDQETRIKLSIIPEGEVDNGGEGREDKMPLDGGMRCKTDERGRGRLSVRSRDQGRERGIITGERKCVYRSEEHTSELQSR